MKQLFIMPCTCLDYNSRFLSGTWFQVLKIAWSLPQVYLNIVSSSSVAISEDLTFSTACCATLQSYIKYIFSDLTYFKFYSHGCLILVNWRVCYVVVYHCRQSLELTYGISIRKPKEGEDPNRPPTDLEILNSYGGRFPFSRLVWY